LAVDLTTGVAVAQQIFESIDADRDGRISSTEGQAYARRFFDSVALAVDGRQLPVTLIEQSFPEFREMASGVGIIRLRGSALFPPASVACIRFTFATPTSRKWALIS
jgi:hypothetical protein